MVARDQELLPCQSNRCVPAEELQTVIRINTLALASILAAVVDARKFLLEAVLARAYRLAVGVDQDSMGASAVNEFSLFPAVAHTSLSPGRQPLVLGQFAGPMKMHALTMVPTIALREKSVKIRPSLSG